MVRWSILITMTERAWGRLNFNRRSYKAKAASSSFYGHEWSKEQSYRADTEETIVVAIPPLTHEVIRNSRPKPPVFCQTHFRWEDRRTHLDCMTEQEWKDALANRTLDLH
jgi:hypothetical protein